MFGTDGRPVELRPPCTSEFASNAEGTAKPPGAPSPDSVPSTTRRNCVPPRTAAVGGADKGAGREDIVHGYRAHAPPTHSRR